MSVLFCETRLLSYLLAGYWHCIAHGSLRTPYNRGVVPNDRQRSSQRAPGGARSARVCQRHEAGVGTERLTISNQRIIRRNRVGADVGAGQVGDAVNHYRTDDARVDLYSARGKRGTTPREVGAVKGFPGTVRENQGLRRMWIDRRGNQRDRRRNQGVVSVNPRACGAARDPGKGRTSALKTISASDYEESVLVR